MSSRHSNHTLHIACRRSHCTRLHASAVDPDLPHVPPVDHLCPLPPLSSPQGSSPQLAVPNCPWSYPAQQPTSARLPTCRHTPCPRPSLPLNPAWRSTQGALVHPQHCQVLPRLLSSCYRCRCQSAHNPPAQQNMDCPRQHSYCRSQGSYCRHQHSYCRSPGSYCRSPRRCCRC